jgi:S1-C subfamily serine protease
MALGAVIAIVVLCLTSCADDPLSSEVDRLEARVDELEAQLSSTPEELIARLDAIPVTADNADEIADLRGKIFQTGVTSAQFQALQSRVAVLERQLTSWSQVVASSQRGVYAVVYGIMLPSDIDVTFIGTAFAVTSTALVTNAHIVDALTALDEQLRQFNARYGTNLTSGCIVVQNLATVAQLSSSLFGISRYRVHEQWDASDIYSPDAAVLMTAPGSSAMPVRLALATTTAARAVRVGDRVCTLGFPGELQGGLVEDLLPVATFKDGTVSALRPRYPGVTSGVSDTYIVQHNLDLSGGTSGSPILDATGSVVAVNNAGIQNVVITFSGPSTISQAALGFGIRADKIREVLSRAGVTAKPVAAEPSALLERLDGQPISSLHISYGTGDLDSRLRKALHGATR